MMTGQEAPVSLPARRLVPVLAVFLALACLAPAWAQDRPVVNGETGRLLDEYLSRLERFGFSGGALAVRGKEVLLTKSYGLADRARRIPLTTDSVYNLGSITKQFTAAAILTLEMQGKLAVTDLASKYLDGVPADKSTITLHHLLTHSSGLESDFSPTDYDPVGREEYVRRALQSTLLFKPGEGYEYSNAGYSLLAAIVEMVSGQPYEVYLTERVLKPAGMRETGTSSRNGRPIGLRTATATMARTGAPSFSGSRSPMRPTGCCEATAACTRRWATCSRGTAPSTPTPCSRRTRGRSTSSRTWRRARADCLTTPTAGPSARAPAAHPSCSTTAATASTWRSSCGFPTRTPCCF